ncbi:MAG: hypothetical protein JNN17_08975 [Verrucomicrobiaceae bacterium]|nr:hypothetical protein [Verrucomicrobiaceae bacterium]
MDKKKSVAKNSATANMSPISSEKFAIGEIRESPLKLANLTATLKIAGIIPYPPDDAANTPEFETTNAPEQLIRQAFDFLKTCADFLVVFKKAEEWNAEQANINRRLAQLPKSSTSPKFSIEDVLKVAGLDRLKLTPDELKELGIKKQWTDLKPRLQAEAVFLYLSRPEFQGGTSFPDATTGSVVPTSTSFLNMGDEERKRMAKSGIDPMMLANKGLIDSLRQAKQLRESKNAADRARKSHEARGGNDAHDSSEAKSSSGNAKQKIRRPDGRFSKQSRDKKGQFETLYQSSTNVEA